MYQSDKLVDIAGTVTAMYTMAMEVVGIFENYAEINPDAQWALKIIKKLKKYNEEDKTWVHIKQLINTDFRTL